MKHFPALAAAVTGVQVGSAIVATRFVIDQTDPASLALLRYAIGFCCLVPAVLWGQRVAFARRDILPIALLGIGQFGVLVALLNYGLRSVPASRGALVFATLPLLTMILAVALRHESLSIAKALGVLLTIGGVGLALGIEVQRNVAAEPWLGELAILGSAMVGALCSVLYRPYLRKYSAVPVSALAMLASVGFLTLLAAGEGFFNDLPPHFSTGGWLAVLFVGAGSGLGYYLWLWALGHAPATRVTVFLALSPVTATLFGAFFLGEQWTPLTILGLVGVALGFWLASR